MRPILPAAVALTLGFLVTACNEQPTMPDASASAIPVSAAEHATPVVSVTGLTEHGGHDEGADPHHHQFLIDKTELQAGWTTFRFHNEADVTHFVAVQRLPEEAGDITLEEYVAAVTEPFQEFFDLWLEGAENPFSAFADTPGWFFDPGITFMGGPGLTGPGLSSETTVNLKPGRYVVECYVGSVQTR